MLKDEEEADTPKDEDCESAVEDDEIPRDEDDCGILEPDPDCEIPADDDEDG